jgi:RNA polymerase sigma-70 factor, ECF subfamily
MPHLQSDLQAQYMSLVKDNAGIIYKVIRLYIDNTEDQKDLYQEIVLQAWHSFTRFDGRSKFSTWLYKVSLNTVLTFRRKNSRIPTDDLEKASGYALPGEKNDDTEMLMMAIKSLGETDRAIVSLHLDGYENEEIAEITGLTKNHVAVKLHRIKQQLTKKLNG